MAVFNATELSTRANTGPVGVNCALIGLVSTGVLAGDVAVIVYFKRKHSV